MIEIICYAGGTCGDLIAELIDSKGAYFRNKAVMFKQERLRFKKPHAFAEDEERDQYLAEMTLKYKSIPSHDLQYHLRRKHNFIGITVSDWNTAQWASKRFKELHQSHVWEDMIAASGADSIEKYAQLMIDFSNMIVKHTDRIITLESIRAGTALQNQLLLTGSKNLYQNWQDLQNGVFIT
jgi:hypothetical protein